MIRGALLRLIAISLLLGGVVRVFANRTLFEAFGIGALYMETPYSLYIYRVLGGFVILSGIGLFAIARAPETHRHILRAYAIGFAVIALVMLAAGAVVGLPYRYYLPDPLYCFAVALLLWRSGG